MLRMIGGFPLSTGHLALLSCISKATPKAIPPDNGSLISHQKGWWGSAAPSQGLIWGLSENRIQNLRKVHHVSFPSCAFLGCTPYKMGPWLFRGYKMLQPLRDFTDRWRHRCFATVSFVRSKYGCAQWWVDARCRDELCQGAKMITIDRWFSKVPPRKRGRKITEYVGGLEMFGTFFIFPYIRNNHPNWLFFRGVETANQLNMFQMAWMCSSSQQKTELSSSKDRVPRKIPAVISSSPTFFIKGTMKLPALWTTPDAFHMFNQEPGFFVLSPPSWASYVRPAHSGPFVRLIAQPKR